MKKNRAYYTTIRCLFFFILGIGGLVYSHFNMQKYNEADKIIQNCDIKVDAPIYKVETTKTVREFEYPKNGNKPKRHPKKGRDTYEVENYHYTLYFTYSVNGKEYRDSYYGSSEYKEGDLFTIYCNSNNPTEWISKSDIEMQSYILNDSVLGVRKVSITLIALGVLFMSLPIIKNIIVKAHNSNDNT